MDGTHCLGVSVGECFMFKVLPHLPSYGSSPIPFPSDGDGYHKEGYVVEFKDKEENSWVGNFQKGFTSYCDIFGELGDGIVFVVAGGTGYRIDVNSRKCLDETGATIDWCLAIPNSSILVISHEVDFEAIDKNGRIWISERISWDGFTELSFDGKKIHGKSYSPIDDRHHDFQLDITDGSFEGGSYNGP